MHIGLFIQNYTLGGIETFLINFINNFKKEHNITLYYNKSHPDINYLKKRIFYKNIKFKSYEILSIEYNPLKKNIILFKLIKYINIIIMPLIIIYQIFKLIILFKNQKIDRLMVINGGYPGGDLCLSASISWNYLFPNKKLIHNFHNIAVKKNKFFLNNFYKNIIDLFLKKGVDEFVSVSKICSKSLNQRLFLNDVKVKTIYNGINEEKTILRSDLRKELKLKKDSKILLMLAEYNLRKGHEFIIKAMNNILKFDNNIYLLICGYKKNNNFIFIKNLVKNSKSRKNIILKGFRKDKINLIKSSNIILIPSQSYESFGYVAIEAMSLKKPVISTDVGGLKEVIDNEKNGYVIKKNNWLKFSKKILLLIRNKSIRKKFSKNGYIKYKASYTAELMSKKYSELLEI